MQNTKLFKISLAISLLGIFLLLTILEYQTIPLYKIGDINKDLLERSVRIQGSITSIKETQGLYILKVKDTSTITIIVFKEDPIDLKKNSLLEIEGKVAEYKETLEIIADKIIELK